MAGADVLRLVIGSGARPVLTPAVLADLRARLAAANAAPVVAIDGGSETFCDGLDLSLVPGAIGRAGGTLRDFASLLDEIARLDRPVVAIVRGPASGGGVGLAAASDLVLATPAATFSLPEALMGLLPAVVFPYVARRIGVARTRLMALGAAPLTAEEACRVGLVDLVTSDPDASLAAYARRAARLDRRAVAEIKSLAATHFAGTAFETDAISRFERLAASEPTLERLRRFAAGDTPWPDPERV